MFNQSEIICSFNIYLTNLGSNLDPKILHILQAILNNQKR